jgi:hypothetical protein
MPMEDYAEKLLKEDFNASVRAVAIDWMLKVFSF